MKKEIFKIQLPLASNVRNPKALIYNKTRTKQGDVPVTDALKILMDDSCKKYFYAKFINGQILLHSEAPEQNW